MSMFYCLVVANKDCSSLIYTECPQKVYDIIKGCHVAIHLLCNTLYRNNGHCPDLKGKSIYSSHMHAENVPEWVNSSARDRK